MDRQILPDAQSLARAAADRVIIDLEKAIEAYGDATWVIAGGSSPMAAYDILADSALHALDWSKVNIVIGDERCVPFDSPDSNWTRAAKVLLDKLPLSPLSIRPATDPSQNDPAQAAEKYVEQLHRLPLDGQGRLRFDHVWLGMGDDGHTLSLFPNHPSSQVETAALVMAVHDSPKPPPDRITLTFEALKSARNCLLLAAGEGKAPALGCIFAGDGSLPVARAMRIVVDAGGQATWLLDKAASSLIAD